MSAAIETVRPNGKVYRRRKPIAAESCMWNHDGFVVIVYGTHDPDLARDLATQKWEREDLGGPLPEPKLEWLKEVPWDALSLGYDRTILSVPGDTRGSTPALRYGGEG